MPYHQRPLQFTLLATGILGVMVGATLAPALPSITEAFAGVEPEADYYVKLAFTIPALVIAFGAPVAGAIIDRWGRRPVLLMSLAMYGVAGFSGFFAGSLHELIIGRIALGVASAGVITVVITLTGDYFSGLGRQEFLGRQNSVMAASAIVLLPLGGALADIGWRMTFVPYLAAFALLYFNWRHIIEPVRRRHHDSQGEEAQQADNYPLIFGVYALAIVSMAILYLVPILIPFYLREMGVEQNVIIGGVVALSSLFMTGASAAYGTVNRTLGERVVFIILFAGCGIGMMIVYYADTPLWLIFGMLFCGIATGFQFPALSGLTLRLVSEKNRGKVVGGLGSAIFIGQFLCPIFARSADTLFGVHGAFLGGALVSFSLACLFLVGKFCDGLPPVAAKEAEVKADAGA